MDPWIPEYELRPPQVANGHRRSVEHAKMGLVHYYAHRHNQRKADYYRELIMSWRVRSMCSVRPQRLACQLLHTTTSRRQSMVRCCMPVVIFL
jgi:hypothetical protein